MSSQHFSLESKLLLSLAVVVHAVSYFTPMQFGSDGVGGPDKGRPWGGILWDNVITDILELDFHLEWYAYVCTLSPLAMLLCFGLYYLMFWQQPSKLPSSWLLAIGLLGTSSIIPAILFWEWMKLGRFQMMWGFFIWDFSFLLFFLGFVAYKKTSLKEETFLSDHLIDEE